MKLLLLPLLPVGMVALVPTGGAAARVRCVMGFACVRSAVATIVARRGDGVSATLPKASMPKVTTLIAPDHEISRDAEVISSIGVALALVRETIERIIPHPQPEDLQLTP